MSYSRNRPEREPQLQWLEDAIGAILTLVWGLLRDLCLASYCAICRIVGKS